MAFTKDEIAGDAIVANEAPIGCDTRQTQMTNGIASRDRDTRGGRETFGEPDVADGENGDIGDDDDGSSDELEAMFHEVLVAERLAVSAYNDIVYWRGESDLMTRRILEEILRSVPRTCSMFPLK